MKRRLYRLAALMAALLALAAPGAWAEKGLFSPNLQYEYLVGSTLWQLSAESRALMMQAFAAAKAQIAQMTLLCLDDSRPDWRLEKDAQGRNAMYHNGVRVAAISDIDDTLVDGARYTANIVGADGDYSNAAFARFCMSDACQALPGAVDFANFCVQSGVELYYVTNRYDQGYKIGQSDSLGGYPESGGGLYMAADGTEIGTTTYQAFGASFYDITLTRMAEMGFPIDDQHLILNDMKLKGSSKEPARRAIRLGTDAYANGQRADGSATDSALMIACPPHEVALLMGDQMGDFAEDFDGEEISAVDRAQMVERYADKWGTEWILLPNAVYGKAFERALAMGTSELMAAWDYTKSPN